MSLMEKLEKAKENLVAIKAAVENGEKGADELSAAIDGVKAAQAQVDAANEAEKLLKSLGTASGSAKNEGGSEVAAKTLGEHFVAFKKSHEAADNRYIAPAFKAAGDPTTSANLVATEYDREPVRRVPAPLTVLDLFAKKSISDPVYTWFAYEETEGSVGITAEGATKNKLTYKYEPKTASLQKLTGLIKMTEELFDDAPYLADAINQDLVDDLNADRQAKAVATLLGTSGIQVNSTAVTRTAIDIADAIIDAIADIEDATNIAPDAVVLAPGVWKVMSKAKNTLNEYVEYAPLKNIEMVKSADVTANHIIVGAFARGAELVSKADGVRVDSTNSNDVDFENNLVSVRAEAREILAVKRPSCFYNITVASA